MRSSIGIVALTALLSGAATAQTPAPTKSLSASLGVVVFPAKGQTPDKQSQDEGECFTWSKSQTGFDPMNPSASAPPPPPAQAAAPPPPSGQRVRGAARGAAAGAVIGEVANGDANDGAAIGATVGVMKGGAEKRKQQAAAQQHHADFYLQQCFLSALCSVVVEGFEICFFHSA